MCWITWQAGATDVSELFDVSTLSLNNGLVQSSVRGVIQDRQGLIWLGTEAGIQRFDGLRLKTLSQLVKGDADPLLGTIWVYHLNQLQSGDILISTRRNGLVKYDTKNRTTSQFSAAGFLPKMADKTGFFETCQDPQGRIFAASNAGLLELEPDKGSWQVLLGAARGEHFSDIDCNGNTVVTRFNSQLLKWHKTTKQTQSFAIDSIVDNPDTLHIQQMSDGKILVGKQDGLYQVNESFNGLVRLWPKTTAQTQDSAVNHMLPETENQLWLATRYQGILLYSLTENKVLKQLKHNKDTPYSLSGNHVIRIMKDHSGLLWTSVFGVGIDRLKINHQALRTYFRHSENALNDNDVTAISEGSENSLWLTLNRSSAARLSLKDMTVTDYGRILIGEYQRHVPGELPLISDIAEDKRQRLWVTTSAGILQLDLKSNTSRLFAVNPNLDGRPHLRGRDIHIDNNGRIYVTDKGGILRYDDALSTFKRIGLVDKKAADNNERFWGVRHDHQGNIYVLGGQNFYRLAQDSYLQPLLDKSRLKDAFGGRMSAFTSNLQGDIYIATQGALLEVLMTNPDEPRLNIYDNRQIPENYFYSVELADNGDLWLSTNNGIVRFNPDNGQYSHFTRSDGVLVQEFNGRSSHILPNGQMLFGGIDGFTMVNPDKLQQQNTSVRLVLSSYQVGSGDAKNFLPESAVTMAYSDHWLHFSFSALDYQNPAENQYAYFLEGFDPAWRSFNNQSQISYTGLPPGNYTLHAKAATKRGQWHPNPMTIDILVTPPLYRSGWAYTLYALLLLLTLSLFIWRRNKLEKERQHYIDLIETSQERMRLALWGSGDSIWDWHLEDNEIYRTAVDFLGYHGEEVATTVESFKQLIHPQDLSHFEHELGEVLNCHTAEYTAQYRLKNKAGEWVWVADQGKVVEISAGNKPIRLSGTLRDISQIKRHEQQLQQLNDELERKITERTKQYIDKNEELSDTLGTLKNAQDQLVESEKMASLGNLVAGISHEINTPVGVALTAASHNALAIEQLQQLFIERKLTVKDMEKGLNQLKSSNDLIESSIKRTAHLIQTFKQVAVDHDRQEWRIVEMPFYLSEIIPTFDAQYANKNIQIDVIDGDFFDIECAPGDIYQIMSQLINNSVSHGFSGREGGKITIETKAFAKYWQLSYQDDGNGMLEDTQSHIFEPFYTTKRGSGYSGLGMHLVYNLVYHSLGGTIECHSEPGKGVNFLLKLPLSKPDRPQPEILQNLLHDLPDQL